MSVAASHSSDFVNTVIRTVFDLVGYHGMTDRHRLFYQSKIRKLEQEFRKAYNNDFVETSYVYWRLYKPNNQQMRYLISLVDYLAVQIVNDGIKAGFIPQDKGPDVIYLTVKEMMSKFDWLEFKPRVKITYLIDKFINENETYDGVVIDILDYLNKKIDGTTDEGNLFFNMVESDLEHIGNLENIREPLIDSIYTNFEQYKNNMNAKYYSDFLFSVETIAELVKSFGNIPLARQIIQITEPNELIYVISNSKLTDRQKIEALSNLDPMYNELKQIIVENISDREKIDKIKNMYK